MAKDSEPALVEYETTGRIRHHARSRCEGPCPFHNPSLHPMIEEPMHLRETGLIERLCRHGVGHPDPDSVAWFARVTGQKSWGVHGCDGCCSPPERRPSEEPGQ